MRTTHTLFTTKSAVLAAVAGLSLSPALFLPAVAHAQSDDPATYNVDNAKAVLPLLICYYNGGKSYYLATDASDQATAKGFGANYVPQLANILQDTNNKAYDNIYIVTNFKQFNVLPSSPVPSGPNNADPSYTPLWQVTQVTWKTTPRVLKSEAAILEAQAKGELTVTPTNIVVNCPVIYNSFGGRLPQAKVILGAGNEPGRGDRDDNEVPQ